MVIVLMTMPGGCGHLDEKRERKSWLFNITNDDNVVHNHNYSFFDI